MARPAKVYPFAAQTLTAYLFVLLTLGSVDIESQGHSVPVLSEHSESTVQFDYFHVPIVAGIEYLVNLPINTPSCHV